MLRCTTIAFLGSKSIRERKECRTSLTYMDIVKGWAKMGWASESSVYAETLPVQDRASSYFTCSKHLQHSGLRLRKCFAPNFDGFVFHDAIVDLMHV